MFTEQKNFCTTSITCGVYHENASSLVNDLCVDIIKSLYDTLKIDELSNNHYAAASALLQAKSNNIIDSCININLKGIHMKGFECRRFVIKKLIDIIIFIGRQGLPFSGKEEAAYNLENRPVNLGNFLELVWLIKDYDVILNEHLQTSIA